MKLDIGCGVNKISSEHVGIDKRYCPGVDIVLDLEKDRLPFEENSVDEICAYHVLEHIKNYLSLVEEIWRVLKPGGKLMVKTPNYKHENTYTDPTHVRTFTPKSFHFFDRRKVLYKESGWLMSVARFSVDSVEEREREISYDLTTQKKKIMLVAPPSSIHTARWNEYISSQGHSVDVAARSMKGLADISLIMEGVTKEENLDRVPELLLPYYEGYDVVNAHFATVYGHVLETVPNGTRKILSIWGEDVLREAEVDARRRDRLTRGLNSADYITTTSRFVADYISKKYGVDKGKICVFPWGHKRHNFYDRGDTSKVAKDRFGVPEDKKILLSARVCKPQNNIERVIDAFEDIGSSAYLVVLTGNNKDTSYRDYLISRASNRQILFLPMLTEEELSILYNRATATISIPNVDQLSTTILESMACGTPVIGSDIGVYRERIIHENNGLLVDPNDTYELHKAMRRSVGEQNFKLSMKDAAKYAVKNDAWEDNARYMLTLYDKP